MRDQVIIFYKGGFQMKNRPRLIILILFTLLLISTIVMANSVTVPKGTQVVLVFDQALSSRTAKVGQKVSFHVKNNVSVGNKTVIKAGKKITGTISKVEKSKHYGINADMRIVINPVKVKGGTISLDPVSKGKPVGGKTGEAAGATVGGAVILGPVGLVGGYFVVGKSVMIKVGDTILTEVAKTVKLNR
jgi:hypothetical protein